MPMSASPRATVPGVTASNSGSPEGGNVVVIDIARRSVTVEPRVSSSIALSNCAGIIGGPTVVSGIELIEAVVGVNAAVTEPDQRSEISIAGVAVDRVGAEIGLAGRTRPNTARHPRRCIDPLVHITGDSHVVDNSCR